MATDVTEWRCDRCEVTTSWMPESGSRGLPTTWAEENDAVFCLACRRALAGEAAIQAVGASTSREGRARARKAATIEFEIGRAADRPNGVIARACGTSPAVVARARQRLV